MVENDDVAQHATLLQGIVANHPHSINIEHSPHPIDRYTCLMHAFDFTGKAEYIAIADYGLGRVYAGADFAHWLFANGKLEEISNQEALSGDLVIYSKNGNFKHVGVLQPHGRVTSKWGIGHLYNHEILEVPESYGVDVKYYRSLSSDHAYNVFVKFAEEQGIPFENVALNNPPR